MIITVLFSYFLNRFDGNSMGNSIVRMSLTLLLFIDIGYILHLYGQIFNEFLGLPEMEKETTHFTLVITCMFLYLTVLIFGSLLLLAIITCLLCMNILRRL